jgi:hypothetical protein
VRSRLPPSVDAGHQSLTRRTTRARPLRTTPEGVIGQFNSTAIARGRRTSRTSASTSAMFSIRVGSTLALRDVHQAPRLLGVEQYDLGVREGLLEDARWERATVAEQVHLTVVNLGDRFGHCHGFRTGDGTGERLSSDSRWEPIPTCQGATAGVVSDHGSWACLAAIRAERGG